MSILEVKGVQYAYDSKKKVLKNIDVQLEQGQMYAILGPSGCGKTTLLRIIADLLQPTSGVITVGGTSPREARLKRRYGIVFQGAVLYDWRTVQKNVEMPLEIMKVPKADRVKQAKKMLELVNLTEFADHYPKQLSGGMQQRAGIAAAMLLNPQVLLADEPTSALDVSVQKQVVEEMLMVRRSFGTAIVLVSHNLGVIEAMADRVLVMKNGETVEYGETGKILTDPQTKYTKELLAAVPRLRRK